jgi:hypothetical protein
MNRNRQHLRRGQVLIFMALTMTVLFGITGLTYDFGMVYRDQDILNASTSAAALAGAEAMGQAGATSTSTNAVITTYSSASGDENYSSFLSGASMVSGYPKLLCLTTVTNVFGVQCYGPSSSNAVQVAQQATVPLYFLRIFGSTSITLTAKATAAMRGASAGPFNVAVVLDATQSMTDTDSASNCSSTRIACAESGIQILLKSMAPCSTSLSTCGTVTSGNVANSVDRVTLLTFPGVTTATAKDDYNCGGTSPTTVAYATPYPNSSTYQVVGFSSDYRTSDTASSLNTSSNLVAAVAGKTGTPCMKVVGGFGTYYAQVITAAQSYLAAEKTSFPLSQNVMILISDGDATATCSGSSNHVCTSGDMPGASTTSGTYSATTGATSTLQECHQAITAAQAAVTAGTRIYAVAYGAAASGCATDTSPTITPCQTMQQIASSSSYFFSDYKATGSDSSCISASQPVTSLSQIFQVISGDLTIARLVPNGTT